MTVPKFLRKKNAEYFNNVSMEESLLIIFLPMKIALAILKQIFILFFIFISIFILLTRRKATEALYIR